MKMYVGYKNDIWEVLAFHGRDFSRKRQPLLWLCRCFCGKEVIRQSQEISSGIAKSCGCYIQSRPGNKYKHDYHTTHGFAKGVKHPLYVNWMGMKQRCSNSKHIGYKHYGLKGITICDQWKNDFVSFMNWCVSNGWVKGLSIDRIDSNKGYCPENCRIVSLSENSKNMNIANPLLHVGSNHKDAKINESIVIEIRNLLSNGVMGSDIANRFNISRSIVYNIKHNRNWRHVK
jgi:hypothetical protein